MFPILLLVPATVLFIIFTLYPVITGFYYSLLNWDGISESQFVGFGNYLRAIEDKFVWEALLHNVYYAIFTVAGKIILGLFLAILLNQKMKGITFYRTAVFIPIVLSFVAVGILWSWIYNPVFGLFNNLLGAFGFQTQIAWTGDARFALASVIAVDIWKWFGYHVVLFLAGLQSIPTDLYEAARVDGATRWQNIRQITLPLMMPIIIINITIATMGAFNVFDIIYVMTAGGPYHATEVIMTYTYTQAFQFHSFGYGAAISYLLLLLIGAVTFIQIRFMRKFEY
ncbi:carbohydrate ABC transporter permease [Paenibacillus aestuarii]|uniref:Carbohydrate ABC transporter permease n=1 Tax=Paenibacillus aestuarii TaxID=516965 RepID=A0ABW0KG46_9BACL|nr:sugar ABC transporter permease [Paenibacillus aestuarii]